MIDCEGRLMGRLLGMAAFMLLVAAGAARQLNSFASSADAPRPVPIVVAAARASPDPPAPAASPGQAEIPKAPDGHFWALADVDGHPVRFLVDTGATAVALTLDDARSLGIDPDGLNYGYTVMTANGPAPAAEVKLGAIRVGDAEVAGVQAFVIQHGLPASLLGMTYLGRLSKFEATPESLVLKS
jgi:aspartyl protease family protein